MLSANEKVRLEKMAIRMRLKALEMGYRAGKNGAHWGGGFSAMEILAVLYGDVMNIKPDNVADPARDRFIISKAHGVLAYYTALNEVGLISDEDLAMFEVDGSALAGHPSKNPSLGIEFSGGSLGLGPGLGIGTALGIKKNGLAGRVFVLLGDGECQEGSVWEAIMAAPRFDVDNLCLIVDANRLQYDGACSSIMPINHFSETLTNFGWSVDEVDGHDVEALHDVLSKRHSMPAFVIANTIKGKGVSFMEDNKAWHHGTMTQQQYELAKRELEDQYGQNQ